MLTVISKNTRKFIYAIFKDNILCKNFCSHSVDENEFIKKYGKKFKTSKFKFGDNVNVGNEDTVKNVFESWTDDFEILGNDKPKHISLEEKNFCGSNRNGTFHDDIDDTLEYSNLEESSNNEFNKIFETRTKTSISVLEPVSQDVSHISPIIRPAYNFAAYVDQSNVLQKLLSLGVDFYKLESIKKFPSFILKLNYEDNVEPYIGFLLDKGIRKENLGRFLTRNIQILRENLDDLEVRINYLQSKNFEQNIIIKIINVNPRWLSFSVADIDCALGYFQQEFELSGNEVRLVAAKNPKLITRDKDHLTKTSFTIKEEMGFEADEIKQLLLAVPKIWHLRNDRLFGRFNIIHNEMMVPHKQIVQDPTCLLSRQFRIRDRHKFMKTLNKAQYDPTKPNYISLKMLVSGNDEFFCQKVANVPIALYNEFLKTL